MSREIIVLHETVWHSIAKDLASIGTLTAAVGLGVYLQSDPLQWIAGLLWVLSVIATFMRHVKGGVMTIDMARKRLDEIEGR